MIFSDLRLWAMRVSALWAAREPMDDEGRDFFFLREKHRPVQTRVVLENEQYGRLPCG